jgi:branched-chain amino acid transport system substrate-binding protein
MLEPSRRSIVGMAAASVAGFSVRAQAQTQRSVRIGVLGDQSSISADAAGPGSVAAVKMAVADFGGKLGDRPIEVLSADMLLKPEIASQIASKWFDADGVDMIIDLPLTSAAAVVVEVARARKKSTIITAAAADFTGAKCSATNVHWTDDTYALAHATSRALVSTGGDTWFFITADYAFGTAMQADATQTIVAAGGKVLGSVRNPLGAADFSSFLLQASSSGAKVIGLASVGGDTITAIKQAAEFGIGQSGQRLAGFLVFISDIHALGLPTAQGLYVASGFYWDRNPASRTFAARFMKERQAMPTKSQAASYAATTHWLKAAQKAGTTDGPAVNAQMRSMPAEYFGQTATIRADGRVMYDVELYQVKTPAESKGPWDYYKPIATVTADQAFRPLSDGGCPLAT